MHLRDFFDSKDLLEVLAQAESSLPSAQNKTDDYVYVVAASTDNINIPAKTIGPIHCLPSEWKQ